MQQRRRLHRYLRSKPHQLDLFATPAVRGTTSPPDWRTFPAATREALTALIARLILDHTHGAHPLDKDEMGRDQ